MYVTRGVYVMVDLTFYAHTYGVWLYEYVKGHSHMKKGQ